MSLRLRPYQLSLFFLHIFFFTAAHQKGYAEQNQQQQPSIFPHNIRSFPTVSSMHRSGFFYTKLSSHTRL